MMVILAGSGTSGPNLSSDIGLNECLKKLENEYVYISDNYIPVVVDIGVFWQYNKWCYNPRNDLSHLKTSVSMWLGFWHTYKELCHNIWCYGLKSLFGPSLHHLWPNQSIMLKPKLGHLETYFTWFSLAYQNVKEMLSM